MGKPGAIFAARPTHKPLFIVPVFLLKMKALSSRGLFSTAPFLFLLFGSVFTWNACQSPATNQPVERLEKYGTGQVSRRYQEINGKKQGKMTDYFPDGRLKAERWFENDRQSGRTVLYYPGGQVKEVQYYQDGKKEGGDSLFYEDGRLEFAVEYHLEKKHGYMRKWAPDGSLVIEARYSMDSLVEVKGEPVRLDYPATLQGPKAKN